MALDLVSRCGARPNPARIASILACLALAMIARPAAADIFKCTDRAGGVTYQNEKCPGGTTAGKVEIFDNTWTADRAEKEAEWRRNATDGRVVPGMPARWVREALGAPAEIRETTTGGATELWAYSFPDRTVQVGMREGQALWSREAPVSAPVAKAAPAPSLPPPRAAEGSPAPQASSASPARIRDAPPAGDASRAAEPPAPKAPDAAELLRDAERARAASVSRVTDNARGTMRGRNCRDVLAELGKPDRQREIPARDASEPDAVTEYVYESTGNGAGRVRILCANGKVEGIDRSVAR